MLSTLLNRARNDEPVYMTDIRQFFQEEGTRPFHLHLRMYDGKERVEWLKVPDAFSREEEDFIRDYLHAVIFNLMSVLGASHIAVYTDPQDAFLTRLAENLPETFQEAVPLSLRTGYGKCLNVNERVLRTLKGRGTRFSFSAHPLSEEPCGDRTSGAEGRDEAQSALTGNPVSSAEKNLGKELPGKERLKKENLDKENLDKESLDQESLGKEIPEKENALLASLPDKAEGRTLLGIDIGGTDIKILASVNGRLVYGREYDWDPSSFRYASEMLLAVTMLIRQTHLTFDGIGISFPDVVIGNRIVGGETAKTKGMRENPFGDYETEFDQISGLCDRMKEFLKEGGQAVCANDGSIAAFTSAVEMAAASGDTGAWTSDLICHSLGTDLGTGWVRPDGTSPRIPLELYNLVVDLGSEAQGKYPRSDVRSTRNLNSRLPGSLQKYASQTGAFRLAVKYLPQRDPEGWREILAKGYLRESEDGSLCVPTQPEDLRKPFLEYLCRRTGEGTKDNVYDEIFRKIGEALAVSWQETEYMLCPSTKERMLFGRLVKHPSAFRALCEGAHSRVPGLVLTAADNSIAHTPLMKQLAAHPEYTVAQFGQAVGAIYYSLLPQDKVS